eukprot:SAG11_NODE_29964_length_305_cov_1.004854_1_plen_51_part_10
MYIVKLGFVCTFAQLTNKHCIESSEGFLFKPRVMRKALHANRMDGAPHHFV